MNAINWKPLLPTFLSVLVYLLIKVGQAVRLQAGADLSTARCCRVWGGIYGFWANPLPSFAPMDLLIGIGGGCPLIRLMVYFKGKNAKKYRERYRIQNLPVGGLLKILSPTPTQWHLR